MNVMKNTFVLTQEQQVRAIIQIYNRWYRRQTQSSIVMAKTLADVGLILGWQRRPVAAKRLIAELERELSQPTVVTL
jgi:hypothetical protein